MSSYSLSTALRSTLPNARMLGGDDSQITYDVVIQFHSAEDIPKMDIVGHADPYFIANIDNKISYKSTIKTNTSTATWDDAKWIVRNIASNATLTVKIYDKDDGKVADDFIGQFEVININNYRVPSAGHDIIGPFGFNRGRFRLSVYSTESSEETKQLPPYTFDGPCGYSRHNSLAIGRLTMLNDDCIYSTFKVYMRRISAFFHPHERQHWNKKYKAAQAIFGNSAMSLVTQSALKVAHKVLYGQTIKDHERGHINNVDELWKFIFSDPITKQIKPCVYTYIIDDHTWRFSETGVEFFVDCASKHALLANACEHVRYAGEFHPRPKYGWNRCDDEWELVFDNGSGTYSPDADLLINLKELLLFNFPGLNIVTYGYKDPQLKESIEKLKDAAEKYKNSTSTIENLILPSPVLSEITETYF